MRTWYRPLVVFSALMAVTAVASVVGLLVDDRELLGAPIWLKPLKFSLSFVAFGLSWAWLLSLPERRPRFLGGTAWVIIAASLLEMVIIIGQVVRGKQSHFNTGTALDSMLFSIMGATVAILLLATMVLSVYIAARRLAPAAELLAIRFGMGISLLGMAVGILMTTASSGVEGITGAHSVGVLDGGPGMPLTGWSTTGGDLRAPHFIGMHALQLLPLLALAIRGRGERVSKRVVWAASLGYLGLVVLTTWQALRGQPLFSPDWVTGTALGVLVVGVALGVLSAPRQPEVSAPPVEAERIPS
ncbi:hypothetical protein [Actinokineospora globicatena]|uniref:Uncharacterized protein n=1 Tax=Actinokineospora globicatena TaxID=103729 RepID=A0A9W6VDM0_9PSEU|nr:hypothetical protein [Actinokineospora globicatena]GLW95421.1 hypothetical protein Aglo03_62370 [Actinokineospora globicatena]